MSSTTEQSKPIGVTHRTLSRKNGQRRAWLEGEVLHRAGFRAHDAIAVSFECGSLTIERREDGSRKVSSRKRRGCDLIVPIIDVTGEAVTTALGHETERVEIQVRPERITIVAHPIDSQMAEREARLRKRVAGNEPVRIGSICHGGGITSHAVETGLAGEGVNPVLSWAIERDERALAASQRRTGMWTESATAWNADIFDIDPARLEEVELLEAGLPCQGSSAQGKAKTGLTHAEEHQHGAVFVAFLSIVRAVKPAAILIENVVAWLGELQTHLIREVLDKLGYHCHHQQVDGVSFGSIEKRKRICFVALSKGLAQPVYRDTGTWADLYATQDKPAQLGSLLEHKPLDAYTWFSTASFEARAAKNLQEGRNFATEWGDASTTQVSTIGAGYARNRGSELKIIDERKPHHCRLATPTEHARIKGIPEAVAPLDENQTTAHTIMGNSVTWPTWCAIGRFLGRLFKMCQTRTTSPVQLVLFAA